MLLAQTLSTTPRSFLAITAKAAFDWEMAALTLSLTVPAGGGAHFTESLDGESHKEIKSESIP